MSNTKFFTFINGGSLHIAPDTKVIPANQFSTLQTAEEVLTLAKQDAIIYKETVVQEMEQLKEQAQREGYAAGFKEWVEQIAKLEEEIAKVREEIEKMIVPVAISAAKKIVNRELETNHEAIVDIVSANLKAVSQHKKVTIYVNKNDLNIVEENRPKLKQQFEHLESLAIRERADVSPGGCMIETEAGIINAQIENRWRVLEAAFEKLKKKPNK